MLEGVHTTILGKLDSIRVTVLEKTALAEDSKEKKKKIQVKTILATVNFRLRVVNQAKHRTLEGNGDTRKVHTKPWNYNQPNRSIESQVESPICDAGKF